MEQLNRRDKRDGVTNAALESTLDRFATLVTRLTFLKVTDLSLSHACHVDHATENHKTKEVIGKTEAGYQTCMRWLSIVMSEGHIEPSQAAMGRLIGWPQKKVNTSSLWIDFIRWCRQHKVMESEIPEKWAFYELLDRLFIRCENKYELPPLEVCQSIFSTLCKQNECY